MLDPAGARAGGAGYRPAVKDLLDERGAWHQRIAATLFHQGVPAIGSVAKPEGRAALAGVALSPAARQAVETGLRQVDRLTGELDPLRRQLSMLSRRQPGCAALRSTQFGIGPVTSVAIWAELGDVRRFASSSDVVRHTGLDITVHSSDGKGPPGRLSRQGPQLLRWAVEAAIGWPGRTSSPCTRRCPQVGLSVAMRITSLPIAAAVRGRPGRRWLM
ncbi:MAG TPA: transposase [Streptosporangiaceae bacterium]|nr:transposase [Streptosporangiaceae bacterium]